MRKVFLTFLFQLCVSPIFSQECGQKNQLAYQAGERISYDVVYNWGVIWVSAGEVMFEVSDTLYKQKEAYWFKGYGKSLKKWDWMYKVRDSFDAIGTKNQLAPLWFFRNTREGSHYTQNQYWYNANQKHIKASVWNSDLEEKEDRKVAYENCVWDVLSAIYYARNLNFDQYAVDDKIPINLIINGKIYDLYIRYLGKEEFEARNGNTYKTIKFKPLLVSGTIFDGGEDMTVWVSDDENKIPIQVEAKILVGSVKAILSDFKGLKHGPVKPVSTN